MAFLLFLTTSWRALNQTLFRRDFSRALLAEIRQSHRLFWRGNPALISAISILIGISTLLYFQHPFWALIWSAYLISIKSYPQLLLICCAYAYGHLHQIPENFSTKKVSGIFSTSHVQENRHSFHKGFLYKGTLQTKDFSLPVLIRLPPENRPLANQKYHVEGLLEQRGPQSFRFKPNQWTPMAHTWSLAEMRYQFQEKYRAILSKHLSPKVSKFLSSITTGDVEDPLLRHEFGRVGLQHILAISGFHFGILVACLSYLLQLFLTRKQKVIALFLAICAYYLFVGASPSVERSFLTCLFFLLGLTLNQNSSPLNLLGCALIFELLCHPYNAGNLGFQLSFSSCAGILLFYSPVDKFLQKYLPKRNPQEIDALNFAEKHVHLFSSFFRGSLSLTLSVNLVILPLLLFHFHQFPWLSFIYNLFIPTLVGLSLFLLLLSLIVHGLFPPLASPFYQVTSLITQFILEIVENPPLAIEYVLRVSNIPATLILIYLFSLGFLRISKSRSTDLFY